MSTFSEVAICMDMSQIETSEQLFVIINYLGQNPWRQKKKKNHLFSYVDTPLHNSLKVGGSPGRVGYSRAHL